MNILGEGNNGIDPTENTKGNAVRSTPALNSYVVATQRNSRKGQKPLTPKTAFGTSLGPHSYLRSLLPPGLGRVIFILLPSENFSHFPDGFGIYIV